MIILIVIFLLIFLMAGCHCPTPIGFCAHDVQYLLLGVPFLWPLRMKIQSFHWWKHKKCPHHISEKCKGHDHVVNVQLEYMSIDPQAAVCGAEKELQKIDELWNSSIPTTKCGPKMDQYWEKERSKIS